MTFSEQDSSLKPWLHIIRKDRKHMFMNVQVFQALHVCLDLNIVVMIASINISQEIFAIDMLTALKSSLEQDRKHVVRFLRLYGHFKI